jgi:hypothetical protein
VPQFDDATGEVLVVWRPQQRSPQPSTSSRHRRCQAIRAGSSRVREPRAAPPEQRAGPAGRSDRRAWLGATRSDEAGAVGGGGHGSIPCPCGLALSPSRQAHRLNGGSPSQALDPRRLFGMDLHHHDSAPAQAKPLAAAEDALPSWMSKEERVEVLQARQQQEGLLEYRASPNRVSFSCPP